MRSSFSLLTVLDSSGRFTFTDTLGRLPRTPARKKAKQLAKHLRGERPDYAYLKQVFKHLREELEVEPEKAPKKLPYVPTEEEIRSFYEIVWRSRRTQDVVLIKTLLYTGVRVSELVNIRLADVDFDRCQLRVNKGKGNKDRMVPFPPAFKETLALHTEEARKRARVTSSSPPGRRSTPTAA